MSDIELVVDEWLRTKHSATWGQGFSITKDEDRKKAVDWLVKQLGELEGFRQLWLARHAEMAVAIADAEAADEPDWDGDRAPDEPLDWSDTYEGEDWGDTWH